MNNDIKTEEEYLKDLEKDAKSVMSIPLELRDNKAFALKAINVMSPYNYFYFRDFSERLRDDKEVILKMVEKSHSSINYASRRLLNNVTVALACLKHKHGTLEYIGFDLIDDLKRKGINDKESAIKYLEVAALQEKLQEELSSNEVKVKKPKI